MLKRVYLKDGSIMEECNPNTIKITKRGISYPVTWIDGTLGREYICNAKIEKIVMF